MVAVIFIDLVGSSRDPGRRPELQRLLFRLRDRLNEQAAGLLVAPFEVVWGDELKGVLWDPRPVWGLYRDAYQFMAGVPFYFSVGLGTIDTPDEIWGAGVRAAGVPAAAGAPATDINLMDGTAFKAARDAMEHLKAKAKEKMPYRIRVASAGSPHYAEALNAYFCILNDLVQHMTPAQRQHFLQAFPWNGKSESPAEAVSRQAVWETLQRARIDAYREANRGIEALLELAAEHEVLVLPGEQLHESKEAGVA